MKATKALQENLAIIKNINAILQVKERNVQ